MMSTDAGIKRRRGRCEPYAATERKLTVSTFLLPELYEWARAEAAASGVSLGRFIAEAVEERKSRRQREEEPAGPAPNPLAETLAP
jgi:hypothetical protein